MEEEKQELIQAEQKPEVTPAEPEKKKKEKKKKHATRKLSLSKRIFIEFAFAGLALALFTSFVGELGAESSIKQQYNDTAYMIAAQAESCMDREMIAKYISVIKSGDGEQIKALTYTPEYMRVRRELNNIRIAMQLNDIYVIYTTEEEVLAYSGKKKGRIPFHDVYEKQPDWKPFHYIFDCYNIEEEAFTAGDTSTMNPKYIDAVIRVLRTGQRQSDFFESKSAFGNNTSAIYPMLDADGHVLAIIGVEIPMVRLESAIRSFVIRTSIVTMGGILIILLFFVLFFNQNVITPITLVAEEATLFGETGDTISERLPEIRTGDEVELLAQSVLNMEHGILAYIANIAKITAEKERISAELNVATQIQADMLPRIFPPFPDRPEFDIYATMDPAKEVGGDFYDFFLVDDDHLGIVIADVSGKGVPAALFMVIAKTLIKNRMTMGESPSEALGNVNNQLCEGNEAQLFVTVWCAVIDLATGHALEVNAGHEKPAIRRKDGSFEVITTKHSPALAVMEDMRFRQTEFDLNPGDTLYVYTDGVPEATDTKEELYGVERMLEALNADPEATPATLLKNVRESIDTFVGEADQFDDITMLGLKYFGRQDQDA
ncbi:MAG: serine/threonine-protein phosphatase [Lachnospiraceae bacterium]|nr:serine/threonine-protein phosphatase [Lachnospiraceae bacterium]